MTTTTAHVCTYKQGLTSASPRLQSLLDDIINSVNILAERALNSVEQGLLNAPPASLGFKTKPPPKHNAAANGPWVPAEAAKTEVEAGTHQLETLLCASIDRNLDKFELFVLRNFLCIQPVDIRDWMRLSHYDGLDFVSAAVAADSDDARQQQNGSRSDVPTLASLNELRRKLRESMRLNALLTAERERNARTLEKLQHLILGDKLQIKAEGGEDSNNQTTTTAPQADPATTNGAEKHGPSPFAFLQQKGTLSAADRTTPLGTTTAFTLSQLQALRALSESLRNLTPDLLIPTPLDEDDDAKDKPADTGDAEADNAKRKLSSFDFDEDKYRSKSWRRQRTEYVEHATRRHLEIVHGLELGRHGEVRDGEWQGEGRQLAHGEVEGLERIAAILGQQAAEAAAAGPPPPTPAAAAASTSRTTSQQQQHQKQPEPQTQIENENSRTPAPKPRSAKSTATTPATASRGLARQIATTPGTANKTTSRGGAGTTTSTRKPPPSSSSIPSAAAAAAAPLEPPPSSQRHAAGGLRRTPPRMVATKPGHGDDDDGQDQYRGAGGLPEDDGGDLMDMS